MLISKESLFPKATTTTKPTVYAKICTLEPLPFIISICIMCYSHPVNLSRRNACCYICRRRWGWHVFLTCTNQDNVDFLCINAQLKPGLPISASFPPLLLSEKHRSPLPSKIGSTEIQDPSFPHLPFSYVNFH